MGEGGGGREAHVIHRMKCGGEGRGAHVIHRMKCGRGERREGGTCNT